MNEDLQQQLAALLLQMREGAPGAWKEMVGHYAAFHWAKVVTHGLVAVTIAVLSFLLGRSAWRRIEKSEYFFDDDLGFALGLPAVLMACACLFFFGYAFAHIPSAIAPLGSLLDALGGPR